LLPWLREGRVLFCRRREIEELWPWKSLQSVYVYSFQVLFWWMNEREREREREVSLSTLHAVSFSVVVAILYFGRAGPLHVFVSLTSPSLFHCPRVSHFDHLVLGLPCR
jgi:hypothetical protein